MKNHKIHPVTGYYGLLTGSDEKGEYYLITKSGHSSRIGTRYPSAQDIAAFIEKINRQRLTFNPNRPSTAEEYNAKLVDKFGEAIAGEMLDGTFFPRIVYNRNPS